MSATGSTPSGEQLVLDVSEPGDVRRTRYALRALLAPLDLEDAAVHDIELVTSEVVTNALVHGTPPVRFVASAGASLLRVEVADRSAEQGTPQPASATATNGRGMAIVASLARRWGVEQRGEGKAVWLEFSLVPDDVDAGGSVRLLGVPVDLYIEAQELLESSAHEVTLLALDDTEFATVEREVVAPLREAMKVFTQARGEGRAAAEAARSAGMTVVDLEWRLPESAASAARAWLDAVEELTALADTGRLLTPAPSAEVRRLRGWLASQVVAQLEGGRPTPFS